MNWKNIRIDEINKMGLGYTPCNPYFEEVYAIYDSKAETYEQFKKDLSVATGRQVQSGEFGLDMKVGLINDGPVTILIDTKNKE